MNERIYVYDRSGVLVNDPGRSVDYAKGLNWDTDWPRGYGQASFNVARDIVASWAVKQAHELIIRDGLKIVYQGRLGNLDRQLRGGLNHIQVAAKGWITALEERFIRKRWVDYAPVSRLEWPIWNDTQQGFGTTKAENILHVRLATFTDVKTTGMVYRERYTMPQGTLARRITFNWRIVTGEGGKVAIYNIDTSTEEWSDNNDGGVPNPETGSRDHTFTDACNIFELRFSPSREDTYNPQDFIKLDTIVVYGKMDNFASPTYDAQEIVKDVLYLKGNAISADYDQIGDPNLALTPFITANDDYESLLSIIQRAASYGDSSQNTWGFCVWDETSTSDGKPKAVLEARSVSDYEYGVYLEDLDDFQDAEDDGELVNYDICRYQDDKNLTRYRTPVDNAALTDTTSVASYDTRERVIDVDHSDPTRVDYVGTRHLAYHKDPLRRTSLSLTRQIRTKAGVWIPANRVRAGQRVKVLDYDGGVIYFIRHTSYNAEQGTLRIEPDLPPDNISVLLAQWGIGA